MQQSLLSSLSKGGKGQDHAARFGKIKGARSIQLLLGRGKNSPLSLSFWIYTPLLNEVGCLGARQSYPYPSFGLF